MCLDQARDPYHSSACRMDGVQAVRVAAMQRVVGPALATLNTGSRFVPHLHTLQGLTSLSLGFGFNEKLEDSVDPHPLSSLPQLRELYVGYGCATCVQGVHTLTGLQRLDLEDSYPDEAMLPSSLTSLNFLHDVVSHDSSEGAPVAGALQAFTGSLTCLTLQAAFQQFDGNDMASLAALPGLEGVMDLDVAVVGGCAPDLCVLPFAALWRLEVGLHFWTGEEQPAWDFGLCNSLQELCFRLHNCRGDIDLRKCTNVQVQSLVFEVCPGSVPDCSARCALDLRTWAVQEVSVSFESCMHPGDTVNPGAPLSAMDVLGAVLAAQPAIPRVDYDSRRLRG